MQSATKDQIAYFASLSLFFSLVENTLIHPIFFFRYGFSVIPLLLCLNHFKLKEFTALMFYKVVVSTLANGTLLSPFVLISFVSTFISGYIMYFLYNRASKYISIYTISTLSSIISSITQLLVAATLLSRSVLSLSYIMLPLSAISGIITAFIASHINYSLDIKKIDIIDDRKDNYALIALYIISIILIFFIKSSFVLLAIFSLSLILNITTKRKIKLSYYILTFIIITFINTLSSDGEVLFAFITKNALNNGILKALKLISIISISQSFSALKVRGNSTISKIFAYSSIIINSFFSIQGSLIKRVNSAICLKDSSTIINKGEKSSIGVYLLTTMIVVVEIVYCFIQSI